MARYGLIGKTLQHSFSKEYFTKVFEKNHLPDYYDNIEIEDSDQLAYMFPKLIEKYSGLNVTIPYKKEVMSLLDSLDPHAEAIGAVNCIQISNNRSKGYNTDYIGFVRSIKPILDPDIQYQALVLGSGGASLAVQYGLKMLDIPFTVVSSSDHSYTLYDELTLDTIKGSRLIVNTTPLGMYPNTEDAPSIPFEAISSHHIAMDLIYNPLETLFLANAKARGAKTLNGYDMLRIQADESWIIWNKPKLISRK
jgi:shikimate dehydrogenase